MLTLAFVTGGILYGASEQVRRCVHQTFSKFPVLFLVAPFLLLITFLLPNNNLSTQLRVGIIGAIVAATVVYFVVKRQTGKKNTSVDEPDFSLNLELGTVRPKYDFWVDEKGYTKYRKIN